MKKIVAIVFLISSMKTTDTKHVILTNEPIRMLDGFFINGDKMREMVQIGRAVHHMQYGDKTRTEHNRGFYTFQGTLYTIKELVQLEKLYKHIPEKWAALQVALEEAKKDFIKKTSHYLDLARAMKDLTVELIRESCIKRNHESMLLRWAQEDNNELEVFGNEIDTFEKLDTFCTDLSHFLLDMIHSCPKAYHQFEKQYLGKNT